MNIILCLVFEWFVSSWAATNMRSLHLHYLYLIVALRPHHRANSAGRIDSAVNPAVLTCLDCYQNGRTACWPHLCMHYQCPFVGHHYCSWAAADHVYIQSGHWSQSATWISARAFGPAVLAESGGTHQALQCSILIMVIMFMIPLNSVEPYNIYTLYLFGEWYYMVQCYVGMWDKVLIHAIHLAGTNN